MKNFLFLLLVLSLAPLSAQDVNADILIIPPYSTRLSDYTDLSDNNSLVISLENPGAQRLEIFFLARIERN
ncbi:MAG: hypothetical protein AAFZ52_17290, partial [Bacteroidota bacterium]